MIPADTTNPDSLVLAPFPSAASAHVYPVSPPPQLSPLHQPGTPSRPPPGPILIPHWLESVVMHRIPDNPYILWVENVRNKQSSGQTRLMKQLCLALPLIGNGEECPDSRQSHRAVHRTVVRRVCGSGKPAQYPYSNSNASRAMDTNGGVRSKGERLSWWASWQ